MSLAWIFKRLQVLFKVLLNTSLLHKNENYKHSRILPSKLEFSYLKFLDNYVISHILPVCLAALIVGLSVSHKFKAL